MRVVSKSIMRKNIFDILICVLLIDSAFFGTIIADGDEIYMQMNSDSNISESMLNQKVDSKCLKSLMNTTLSNNLSVDLKIRKSGGIWKDDSITVTIDNEIEFKIKIESTINNRYQGVSIVVLLPAINGKPMFSYVKGSASPGLPNLIITSEEAIVWWYFSIEEFPKIMTFRAVLKESGTASVDLYVDSVVPEDSNSDSVQIIGKEKGRAEPDIISKSTIVLQDLIKAVRAWRIFLLPVRF